MNEEDGEATPAQPRPYDSKPLRLSSSPPMWNDRARGMRTSAYLAAKVTVLLPVLLAVDGLLLAVLRASNRLPALDATAWTDLGVTVALVSFAALATGLLASAAVGDTTQATLALPMICFPQARSFAR